MAMARNQAEKPRKGKEEELILCAAEFKHFSLLFRMKFINENTYSHERDIMSDLLTDF